MGERKQTKIIQLKGGRQNLTCRPCALKGESMKKLLIIACVVLVVAFTGGFLTSYFTTTHSKANTDVQQDCGHDEQILALMHQIETQQDRINYFTELVDLYSRVVEEFSKGFEIQYQWVEELLGQISYYNELINQANAEIRELERQIAELQRQLIPVDWNGTWGTYWYDAYNDEHYFEELVTIENGVFTFTLFDDEAEISMKILGNTLIFLVDYPDSNTVALVVTYCAFGDYFILSDLIILIMENEADGYDGEIYPFLDTEYYYVSIMGDPAELIKIQRGGLI